MNGRDDDKDKEELPRDNLQRDRPGNKDNDTSHIQTHHTDGHTLAADVRREDLRQIQVLRGVNEGRPEEDEEEDEEDGGALPGHVVGAEVSGQHRAFADERNYNAADPGEHEGATTDPVDEEGCEDIAREGERYPERAEEEGHVGFHS